MSVRPLRVSRAAGVATGAALYQLCPEPVHSARQGIGVYAKCNAQPSSVLLKIAALSRIILQNQPAFLGFECLHALKKAIQLLACIHTMKDGVFRVVIAAGEILPGRNRADS